MCTLYYWDPNLNQMQDVDLWNRAASNHVYKLTLTRTQLVYLTM